MDEAETKDTCRDEFYKSQLDSLQKLHNLLESRLNRELSDVAGKIQASREESRLRFNDFVETHVRNHEREHEQEQRASTLAMTNLDRRLEGMNEFRAQINATEIKYATKDELGIHALSNDARISSLDERIRNSETKAATKDDVAVHASANAARISILEERMRAAEQAAVQDRNTSLDRKTADDRFRALERLVWMASGALSVIMLILQYFRSKP